MTINDNNDDSLTTTTRLQYPVSISIPIVLRPSVWLLRRTAETQPVVMSCQDDRLPFAFSLHGNSTSLKGSVPTKFNAWSTSRCLFGHRYTYLLLYVPSRIISGRIISSLSFHDVWKRTRSQDTGPLSAISCLIDHRHFASLPPSFSAARYREDNLPSRRNTA